MTTPITAPEVSDYLRSKGWQLDGDWRGARVWRLGDRVRLLVPMHPEYDDAEELLELAVATIAKQEGRPERDVRLDIAEPMVDTQYFRMHPDTPSGTIPLPLGLRATQGIHALVKAAAASVQSGTSLLYERYRNAEVDAFLRRVLLGAAAPGSYVLTARIPAAGTGRSVSSRLCEAVAAARTAAQETVESETQSPEPFYDTVESGVSANLCRALADLGGGERNGQAFEIGFGWARDLPGPEAAPEQAFTAEMPAVLGRAADELEALARSGEAVITGRVREVQTQPGPRYRAQVHGELRTPRESRVRHRSIWVVLDTAGHESALQAYRQHDQVFEARGALTSDKNGLELIATSVRIVP